MDCRGPRTLSMDGEAWTENRPSFLPYQGRGDSEGAAGPTLTQMTWAQLRALRSWAPLSPATAASSCSPASALTAACLWHVLCSCTSACELGSWQQGLDSCPLPYTGTPTHQTALIPALQQPQIAEQHVGNTYFSQPHLALPFLATLPPSCICPASGALTWSPGAELQSTSHVSLHTDCTGPCKYAHPRPYLESRHGRRASGSAA